MKLRLFGLLFCLGFVTMGYSQGHTEDLDAGNGRVDIPDMEILSMEGDKIKIRDLVDGYPLVISFWATWCSPCKKELNAIADVYDIWQEETGVNLVAVSIDDARTAARVTTYVNGQGWEYEILMDPNSDFRRAMNVNNVPHTFLLNGKGEIVYEHNNYAPGDEEELFEEILNLTYPEE